MYANNSKSFWAIWNSKNRHNMLSNKHKAEDFAAQFCNNFRDKTENDLSKLNEFMKHVETRDDELLRSSFSAEVIKKAVSALNLSIALDSEKLCILHVLYAHPAIFACLSMLFSAMMHHSYVSSKVGLNIVLPTLKNEAKSSNDITNYRPISIMPVKSKIFEKCIVYIIEPYFKFSDNQYGFVNNGGCGKALFTYRHVVNYFRDRGSYVYCAL